MRRFAFLTAVFLAACTSVPETERPAPVPVPEHEHAVNAAWSRSVAGWRNAPDDALTPVLVEDKLLVADGAGWLRAFDAQSGKVLWEQRTGAAISGGLGYGAGLVLAGTHAAQILAFDPKDGVLRWRARLSSEVLVPPAGGGDIVVAHAVDGKVFGLDATTGAQRWLFEQTVPALSLRGISAAVIAGDTVYVGLASGKVVALSLDRGELRWEAVIGIAQGRSELDRMVDVDADPVVTPDAVYAVGFQSRVAALNRETGRLLWARDMSSYTGLAVDDDAVYVSDASGMVWALSRSSGAPLWKQDKLHMRGVSAPRRHGPYVAVGDYQGYIYWLARDDGHIVARAHVDDAGFMGPPYVSGEMLYALGKGGTLEALRLP